jgi:signal transduction histidine kinase
LKNPLTAVTGFCEFLNWEGAKLDERELHECLRQIAVNAGRMQNIIDELLLLAGVRQAEVKPSIVEMGQVVEHAWQRLQFLVDEHQPEFVCCRDWPPALGYGPWVEEVWANYLSNAMKYGGRPPRVEVGAETEGDRVRFWVKDNGPGITPEDQTKLFTPFTRLHQARATGHGLGLSIVRRIMEKLGGEAWVDSAPGKGSRFGFSLPRAPEPGRASTDRAQAGAVSIHANSPLI